MRPTSILAVLALALAVGAIGGGTAFAQTPVPTADASDDVSNVDTNAGDEKPKAQESGNPGKSEPKAEEAKPEQPKAEDPKSGKPEAEQPKPETEGPNPGKPEAEAPKPEEPKAEQPNNEGPKAEKPKAEEPKAEKPKNDGVESGAASDPVPPRPAAEPKVAVAKAVTPRARAAPRATAKRVTTRRHAAHERREGAPHPTVADTPGGTRHTWRDLAHATVATKEPVATKHTMRASDGAAAQVAASLDREQAPAPVLQASGPRYDASLVLAITLGAGVGFLFGRRARRQLRSG